MDQQITRNPPLMLPPRRCADHLGLSEHTVRKWIQTGYIRAIPCGRKKLINVDSLTKKLNEV